MLVEITSKQDRCGDSLVCPAVFEDSGKLVIIGKAVNLPELAGRVGAGETAFEIDAGIVKRALLGRKQTRP